MPEINPFRDRLELTSSRILKIISIGSVKLKLIHFWKNHFRIFIVPIRLVMSGCLTLVQLRVQKIWDCPPKFHPNNFHPNPISLNFIGTIVQLLIFLALTLSVPSKKSKDWYFYQKPWQIKACTNDWWYTFSFLFSSRSKKLPRWPLRRYLQTNETLKIIKYINRLLLWLSKDIAVFDIF